MVYSYFVRTFAHLLLWGHCANTIVISNSNCKRLTGLAVRNRRKIPIHRLTRSSDYREGEKQSREGNLTLIAFLNDLFRGCSTVKWEIVEDFTSFYWQINTAENKYERLLLQVIAVTSVKVNSNRLYLIPEKYTDSSVLLQFLLLQIHYFSSVQMYVVTCHGRS